RPARGSSGKMAAPTSRGSRGFEPGAAPYGNFPNYSRFHPPEGRVSLLPPGLLRSLFPAATRPLLGLDVGCNSGELSVALYQHLLGLQDSDSSPEALGAGRELKLLCCDIDPELIRRAQQSSPFPSSISFASLDIMDPVAREPFLSSFLQRFGRSSFDIGFCMSVTMWIHLNHGDRGLLELLALLASLCTFLLVEPQPWRCYRAAARRLRRLGRDDFEHFRSLRINGDMAQSVTRILTQQCAMELVRSFGSTSWDRSLLLFKSTGAHPPGLGLRSRLLSQE
ncbi:BN3D2 methyltransferase, partial [Zosterops hypoxanthus]|nr:BN3D2 methyltransferase [Zosterops hypoxanthus]